MIAEEIVRTTKELKIKIIKVLKLLSIHHSGLPFQDSLKAKTTNSKTGKTLQDLMQIGQQMKRNKNHCIQVTK